MTEEQAKEYYDHFHAIGELSDEELDNVAGGGSNVRMLHFLRAS